MSSFDSTTFTKPTGTPIISFGASLPAFINSSSAMSAVGALPMANMSGFLSPAAFSMDTAARVTPRRFASAATSSSAMKQCASPPSFANVVLLIPAFAICVSVTISQPLLSASTPIRTACSEKTRFFT